MDEGVYESLHEHKREGESWTDLAERAVNALESTADGQAREDVNALTPGHIDDIAAEVERRVEKTLETTVRRR